jgi:hypothetical protein
VARSNAGRRGTIVGVSVSDVLRAIHNPRGRTCFCADECWCRRTRLGRLVRWWFPARYLGIRHVGRR